MMIHLKQIDNTFANSRSPHDTRVSATRNPLQDRPTIHKGITPAVNHNQFYAKNNHNDVIIRDATPPKGPNKFDRSFYAKQNAPEIFIDTVKRDDRLNSTITQLEHHKIGSTSPEHNNRDNRFKTLNVKRDNDSFIETGSKVNKMNTINPGENLKNKVLEQIKKVFKKTETNKRNDSISQSKNLPRNRSKDQEQSQFPTIPQAKRIVLNDQPILIEPMYAAHKNSKEIATSGFHVKPSDYEKRTKSTYRHASVLRGRAPLEPTRRAFSHQRSSKQKIEDINKVTRGRQLEDMPDFGSNSSFEGNKTNQPQNFENTVIISLAQNGPKVIQPRPPNHERSSNIPNRASSQRPDQKGHLKERNPNLKVNTFTRNFVSEMEHFSSCQTNLTEEPELKNMGHYKTQPILEENQQFLQAQNNKSIDDGLRKTVDSQNEISYPVKQKEPEKGPIQISSNFAISPANDSKRGRFIRKIKEKMKREDSSKNIMEDVDEHKMEKYQSTDAAGYSPIKADRSKSPFDDLLETSLMSYEKDSIARLRNPKEIEMTVSMTKNLNFKRSKVIVSKGNYGSADPMASTNVTNSKSTYKNESIQSNIKDESQANGDSGNKRENLEYDFAFEDDSYGKKKSQHVQKKNLIQLNVIAEEINKEKLNPELSEDPTLSPSSKKTTITPLYVYAGGQKLAKNPLNKSSVKREQNTFEDDDICINGENSDIDVVNSRVGLDRSPGPLTDSVNLENPFSPAKQL